jgi:maleylacetoacetate isomerase
MPKPVLYTYWRSSCSYRVRLAFAYKKIAYEPVFVSLGDGQQLASEYRKKSPIGHVPCLVVDGREVVESVAILELMDELWPDPPLYPKEIWARTRVRTLVETINAGTQPLQNLAVLTRLTKDPEERKAWAAHWNVRGLAAFESLMEKNAKAGPSGPFACGESFGAADCCLLPQVYSARRFDVDLTPFPRIVAAERAAMALAYLHAAIPENQADSPRSRAGVSPAGSSAGDK